MVEIGKASAKTLTGSKIIHCEKANSFQKGTW